MWALAQAIGSGAALVMVGVAMLVKKYQQHLPDKAAAAHPWITRARLVLMFMGGAALTITVFGGWIADGVLWLVGFTGSWGPAALKVVALSLLLVVVFGLLRAWSHAGMAAMLLPIVLAMFASGFFHNLDNSISPKARNGATQLSDWLGNPKGGK